MSATADMCFYDFKVKVIDDKSIEFRTKTGDFSARCRVFIDEDDLAQMFIALGTIAAYYEMLKSKKEEEK